jgi:hypothetical protein
MRTTVALGQVPGDGFGAGVVSGFGEFLPQLDDPVLDGVGDAPRVAAGPSGVRFKSCFAFGRVTGDEGLDPAAGDAVVAGDFTFRAAFDYDCCDHDPGHRHRPPQSSGCKRCRETPVNYVVNSDTLRLRYLQVCSFSDPGSRPGKRPK